MESIKKEMQSLNGNFEELCTECSGLGHIGERECLACDATGLKQEGHNNLTMESYENHYSRHAYDKHNPDHSLCPKCNGQGHTDEKECFTCNATGLLKSGVQLYTKPQKTQLTKVEPCYINGKAFTLCTNCGGQGHNGDQECLYCDATGLREKPPIKYDLQYYTKLYRKHISSEQYPEDYVADTYEAPTVDIIEHGKERI